ncbi:MAG: DHH family phosphoesterase, partial [Eubacteriales bacterium]|nr:DHH family phosphoesterase [Eubacteriales bacterium]
MKTIKNKELLNAIKEAKNIAVVTHKQPDADAIGSMLAICRILESLGKKANAYCQDPLPEYVKHLHNADRVLSPSEYKNDADLVISVDASDKDRLGSCSTIFDSISNTIQIDHHATNTMFAKFNEVDTSAAASGMLVFRLAKALDVDIDNALAEQMYAATSSDTGNFCFPS